MTRGLRRKAGGLLLVAAAGVSLAFTGRRSLVTDLPSLLGSGFGGPLAEAVRSSRDTARFLVRAPSRQAAEARLAALGVPAEDGAAGDTGLLKALSGALLTERTRDQLRRGDYAAVRAGALARLYAPTPPIVPVAQDPFLLVTEYVAARAPKDPKTHLLTRRLSAERARPVLERLRRERPGDIHVSGAPFHTASAAGRARAEINVLGAISLAGILAVGWGLFRSFRFVLPLVGTLAAAFAVGTASVFALFPHPHVLTFVFGTTLAGIGVDYVYHACAARTDIRPSLAAAFASTGACFIPLLLAEAEVLRQMAAFTVAGLATTYVFARGLSTGRVEVDHRSARPPRVYGPPGGRPLSRWVVYGFLALFAGTGILRVRTTSGPEAFYRPDAFLASEEKAVAAALGTAAFLPSVAQQREHAELVRRLYENAGAAYCEETGLPRSVLVPPDPSRFFEPRAELERLFATYARETYRLLAYAFLALAAVSFAFFRPAFRACAVPVLAANVLTVATLGWLGTRLTFFHALSFFLFTGLGADYAIFLNSRHAAADPITRRTVTASFLTSVLAFASLALTTFPVTHGMGVTLAVGLGWSYAAAHLYLLRVESIEPVAKPPHTRGRGALAASDVE